MFVIFTLIRMDPVSSSGQDILSNVFGRFSESFQKFLKSYRKTIHCVTQTQQMHYKSRCILTTFLFKNKEYNKYRKSRK